MTETILEQYLTAKGYSNITTPQLDNWRREHMSDLVNAFDFENVGFTLCSGRRS